MPSMHYIAVGVVGIVWVSAVGAFLAEAAVSFGRSAARFCSTLSLFPGTLFGILRQLVLSPFLLIGSFFQYLSISGVQYRMYGDSGASSTAGEPLCDTTSTPGSDSTVSTSMLVIIVLIVVSLIAAALMEKMDEQAAATRYQADQMRDAGTIVGESIEFAAAVIARSITMHGKITVKALQQLLPVLESAANLSKSMRQVSAQQPNPYFRPAPRGLLTDGNPGQNGNRLGIAAGVLGIAGGALAISSGCMVM